MKFPIFQNRYYSILLLLLFYQILIDINIFNIDHKPSLLILTGFNFVLFFKVLIKGGFDKNNILFFLPYILFIIINVFHTLTYFTQTQLNVVVFYFSYGSIIVIFLKMGFNKLFLTKFAIFSLTLSLILMIGDSLGSLQINTNRLAIMLYTFSFAPFLIVNKYFIAKRKIILNVILIILYGYFILKTGSRGVMLAIIFSVFNYVLFDKISYNKKRYSLYFVLIIVFIFLFTYLYPQLEQLLVNFESFADFIYNMTGKRLYSGRNIIWNLIIDQIKLKPVIGFGSSISIQEVISRNLSAHNLYLEIAFTSGMFGLSLIIKYLSNIWQRLFNNNNSLVIRFVSSYYVGILVLSITEVFFFRAFISLNYIIWIIIALGLSEMQNEHF